MRKTGNNGDFSAFSLTCIKNYLYLCKSYEDKQHHIEDTDALGAGRCHPLLDVQRRRLADHRPCCHRRDELDLDVAVVPLWHLGTGLPRMALAPDTGACRREAPSVSQRTQHLPELCRIAAHTPCGRVHTLWRPEALRQHLVPQSPGNGGDRTCHRLFAGDGHHRDGAVVGDEHLWHFLSEDRHQHPGHSAEILFDGLPGGSRLPGSYSHPATLPVAKIVNI